MRQHILVLQDPNRRIGDERVDVAGFTAHGHLAPLVERRVSKSHAVYQRQLGRIYPVRSA